jgi:hypothetical protein
MALMNEQRTLALAFWVKAKDDADNLAPVCSFLIGVEQAEVGREVPFVVRR